MKKVERGYPGARVQVGDQGVGRDFDKAAGSAGYCVRGHRNGEGAGEGEEREPPREKCLSGEDNNPQSGTVRQVPPEEHGAEKADRLRGKEEPGRRLAHAETRLDRSQRGPGERDA